MRGKLHFLLYHELKLLGDEVVVGTVADVEFDHVSEVLPDNLRDVQFA